LATRLAPCFSVGYLIGTGGPAFKVIIGLALEAGAFSGAFCGYGLGYGAAIGLGNGCIGCDED